MSEEDVPAYAASLVDSMAHDWHDASDHAKDGAPFGAWLTCNCERIARRAFKLGWLPESIEFHG
ncbi:hypothetical protein FVO59_11915 [Microbacterium esteraromaticum]|uniref:Uncharacterized protein n=1 Tax=Microbacterium esteraromaticum TaxID=57043 RepID=A0A7D7WI92_9MICO|nr:hypothetical protein [Microbacterium esteraromaticum]QMU97833.1 hypothetical protein FVO59_11915 [Microbacterium esteraromaticum]